MTLNQEMAWFIDHSPTAFHVTANLCAALDEEGYRRLYAHEDWGALPDGRYYTTQNDSTLIAFRLEKGQNGFMITASHSDSPLFKIKDHPTKRTPDSYVKLNTERYGGVNLGSWFDRPLSVAGRVIIRNNGSLTSRLIDFSSDAAVIPSVAGHLTKGMNAEMKDLKTDLIPLFSMGSEEFFRRRVAELAGADEQAIIGCDLYLYNNMPATIWGEEGELISSPRLDDLQCAFASLKAFLHADAGKSMPVLCVFDNEEVGSSTKQGANSDYLCSVLRRITGADYDRMLSNSFLLSADNAHAVHPNHPELSDGAERPVVNGGLVIKFNANQSYTTDSVSASILRLICAHAEVPVQVYSNRSDLPGGSTLGSIATTHLPVRAADIGAAQLAMHSAFETAGTKDTVYLYETMKAFFSASLVQEADCLQVCFGR